MIKDNAAKRELNQKLNQELVKDINEYMTDKGLKRYELANKLGTTPSNVTNWLSGKHKISPAWRRLIWKVLGE